MRTADRLGLSPAFEVEPSDDVAALIPRALCTSHRIAPLRADGRALALAMADPSDSNALHAAALATGLEIEPVAALELAIASFARERAPDVEVADADAARRAHADHMSVLGTSPRFAPRGPDRPRLAGDRDALKGGHLHAAHAEAGFGYVARSFAGIYVLILVFEGPFDEIGARRATQSALPAIERLVLSLPPRDPSTQGAKVAVAIRRLRRRGGNARARRSGPRGCMLRIARMSDAEPPTLLPSSGEAAARERAERLCGKVISKRYRIDAVLAMGGMGAVYKGEQRADCTSASP